MIMFDNVPITRDPKNKDRLANLMANQPQDSNSTMTEAELEAALSDYEYPIDNAIKNTNMNDINNIVRSRAMDIAQNGGPLRQNYPPTTSQMLQGMASTQLPNPYVTGGGTYYQPQAPQLGSYYNNYYTGFYQQQDDQLVYSMQNYNNEQLYYDHPAYNDPIFSHYCKITNIYPNGDMDIRIQDPDKMMWEYPIIHLSANQIFECGLNFIPPAPGMVYYKGSTPNTVVVAGSIYKDGTGSSDQVPFITFMDKVYMDANWDARNMYQITDDMDEKDKKIIESKIYVDQLSMDARYEFIYHKTNPIAESSNWWKTNPNIMHMDNIFGLRRENFNTQAEYKEALSSLEKDMKEKCDMMIDLLTTPDMTHEEYQSIVDRFGYKTIDDMKNEYKEHTHHFKVVDQANAPAYNDDGHEIKKTKMVVTFTENGVTKSNVDGKTRNNDGTFWVEKYKRPYTGKPSVFNNTISYNEVLNRARDYAFYKTNMEAGHFSTMSKEEWNNGGAYEFYKWLHQDELKQTQDMFRMEMLGYSTDNYNKIFEEVGKDEDDLFRLSSYANDPDVDWDMQTRSGFHHTSPIVATFVDCVEALKLDPKIFDMDENVTNSLKYYYKKNMDEFVKGHGEYDVQSKFDSRNLKNIKYVEEGCGDGPYRTEIAAEYLKANYPDRVYDLTVPPKFHIEDIRQSVINKHKIKDYTYDVGDYNFYSVNIYNPYVRPISEYDNLDNEPIETDGSDINYSYLDMLGQLTSGLDMSTINVVKNNGGDSHEES